MSEAVCPGTAAVDLAIVYMTGSGGKVRFDSNTYGERGTAILTCHLSAYLALLCSPRRSVCCLCIRSRLHPWSASCTPPSSTGV